LERCGCRPMPTRGLKVKKKNISHIFVSNQKYSGVFVGPENTGHLLSLIVQVQD
jgi:hypothetical protein